MKPRILIDLERTRYPYSGLGYYGHALARGLQEARDPSLDLHYYAPTSYPIDNRKPFSPLHSLLSVQAKGYDLVHITHQRQHYFPQLWGAKCIVTLHDLNFLTEPLPESKRKKLLKLVASNLNRAHGIVCISEFVRHDLEQHRELFQISEETPITVVHNGIFLPEEGQISGITRDPIVPNAPYLLALGVLHEKKQQHLLIPALCHLPAELHLVLVYSEAKSEYLSKIQYAIQQHRLEDRVHLLCAVSDVEKASLLQHCRALLQPSIAEGFGLPVVEAMALGKPIFLRPATSLPEVGGDVAYYFDEVSPEAIAGTILSGLSAYDMSPSQAEALRARARLFDYRRMAQGYLQFYHEILSR